MVVAVAAEAEAKVAAEAEAKVAAEAEAKVAAEAEAVEMAAGPAQRASLLVAAELMPLQKAND